MAIDLILVVDDEASIVDLSKMYLEREGFQVMGVGDGKLALKAISEESPALVVLDVMLPELNGFEVCKKLRSEDNQVPIIMLTARDEDIDKILGLELGADDYMTKPFNPRELVARVKAVLRRNDYKDKQSGAVIRVGDLAIDQARREVRCEEELIELRTQEFEVLRVLSEHPGWVFSREKLLSIAWGFDFFGQTRTVDVHIAQLRRKLAKSQVAIKTVTGIGYKLVV
ncbi:MAG TPA: response regulator transcription factor [Anaerolineae bacterium]|nr:response regulator transcription factor [Anaerolineae bacterium]